MYNVPINNEHWNMHQKMPVFLLIESSSVDCKCKKLPCAVQMTAAPMPRMADDVYMKRGVGLRYMTIYKRYANADTNIAASSASNGVC